MQNKPFPPTPRPDTASEEEKMPCPDRSLCISSFDPVRLGFGKENPNEFRSAPGPAHREGCHNAWCLLFPQLQTPHLALQTQSSTSSEQEVCEKTEAAVPVLGSFTLYSTHPKPPKETPREQQDGHMLQAPISDVTSDLPHF